MADNEELVSRMRHELDRDRPFDRALAEEAIEALSRDTESGWLDAREAAASLIDGWTVATNTKHLLGWGAHANAVADMLSKRDAEMADAVRALLPTPPEAKTP